MKKVLSILVMLLVFQANAKEKIQVKTFDLNTLPYGKVKSIRQTCFKIELRNNKQRLKKEEHPYIEYGFVDDKSDFHYVFDEKGNVTNEYYYDSFSGEKWDSVVYTYNKEGYRICNVNYSKELDTESKVMYQLNESGQPIQEDWYGRSPMINMQIKHMYNDKGQRIETSYFFPSESNEMVLAEVARFEYNDKGFLIIETRESAEGKEFLRLENVFNRKAKRLLSVVVINGKSREMYYEYEIDDHGNWTKETVLIDNKEEYVTFREYEYYN